MRALIISDIDGVLADCKHRLYLVKGDYKLWDEFYSDDRVSQDTPIPEGADFLKAFTYTDNNNELVLCTGRNEKCREATRRWLCKQFKSLDYSQLWMREEGDHRKPTETKPELVQSILKAMLAADKTFTAIYYIDDDPDVVKAVCKSDSSIIGITYGIERMEE